MTTDKETVLERLNDWLRRMDEHRLDHAACLTRGKAPCTGGSTPLELICSECYGSFDTAKLGDPCPLCEGKISYRHDPEEWAGKHDFDGGECWRCQALEPSLHEGTGHFAIMNAAEPTAEVPESMVREIVRLLDPK